MRFLVIAPPSPITDGIFNELRALKNFEPELFTMNLFYFSSSYLERKIYKLGVKISERKFNHTLINNLNDRLEKFRPDFLLILNGSNVPRDVQKFIAGREIILWAWDSVKNFSETEGFTEIADEIFCFEQGDLKYLSGKNLTAHYLPLGANEKIYFPLEKKRDVDISFVGLASKERLEILERVCEMAYQKNFSVKVGGIFYDAKHFWKKYFFERRYPNLAKFLENRIFAPEEVADLYRRSKICLNINTAAHKSLSPRTFEICATKSFQLMNAGQNSCGLVNFGKDIAIFQDTNDLIEKIIFYLSQENLRKEIALNGYNSVMKNCTLKKSVEKLFSESEVIKNLSREKL